MSKSFFSGKPVSISLSNLLMVCMLFPIFFLSQLSLAGQMSDGLDRSFLNEQPYKKTKRLAELSNIKTVEELLIIKNAINPIMSFLYALAQIENESPRLQRMCTENGLRNLRYPPPQNKVNRFTAQKTFDWEVIDRKSVV